jgi:hypothetical protein
MYNHVAGRKVAPSGFVSNIAGGMIKRSNVMPETAQRRYQMASYESGCAGDENSIQDDGGAS